MSPIPRVASAALLSIALIAGGAGSALAQQPAAAGAAFEAAGPGQGGAERGGGRQPSRVSLQLKGLRGGDLTVGKAIKARGTLRPYVQGQRVSVLLRRGKRTLERTTVTVRPKGDGGAVGRFKFSKRLIKPGRYSVEAVHAKNATLGGSRAESRRFHIRYPDLGPGASGDAVKTFNGLLADLGYVNDGGANYNAATGRAVLAYHKVNGEARKESSSSGMFKRLAKGKGGFKLKYPGAGKHVETDLSRQVMVLADDGKVEEIYTISSGAPATPTILGKFRFYRKDPGFNSLGMYYSVYFIRGYAIHGFASVPTYPASHGCLRNPIPDSVHIYNWVDLGDPIYVYR